MKDKLIEMLIEAKGYRAYCIGMYNRSFFFGGKWLAEADSAEAEIEEIERQLEELY